MTFPMVVPRRLFGANERLNVAAIGSGGKGQVDIDGCNQTSSRCDVDPGRRHLCSSVTPRPKYADFRKMLEKEAIDAVIVSTPDHTHAPAACTSSWANMSTVKNR